VGVPRRSYFNCCTAKKGYSGTVVFIKDELTGAVAKKKGQQQKISAMFGGQKKKPEEEGAAEGQAGEASSSSKQLTAQLVGVNMGFKEHDSNAEGRVICCEFDRFFVVGVYVPNSGMQLERLEVRRRRDRRPAPIYCSHSGPSLVIGLHTQWPSHF
jgi:exonuclease III